MFSTFNPSSMPPELIEGTLVQREALVERLTDIFEQSALQGSKHNVLLVGPRGIGKSHLVSVVYHRLKAQQHLTEKLSIAYLREDEWGISSFLDLLIRTLRSLCEELGQDPDKVLGDLSSLSRAQAENHVWHRLKNMLESKTLLLIIENLDAVFEKIGEQGQRQWRALIQTYPQWAVLATTPALFSAISRQVSPFYGFFEVIYLQPLSFGDAVALLRKLAQWNEDEKTAAFLDTPVGKARVRAVQHLAGGNHRIFVLFYDFLYQGGTEHFVTPLLKTVDALTPYYQSQMTKLSPQQQKIVSFLCEHQKPATVTAIAVSCFTTNQTAASQLKQLLRDHYVRVNRVGRESFYELNEPLLRICVEAKTHHGRPLDLLVDFIRYWFSREELENKLSHTDARELEKSYLSAALREYDAQDAHLHLSPEIASLCNSLNLHAGPSERSQETAQELAELSKIAEDWPHYARAMAWLNKGPEAIPALEEILKRDPHSVEILGSLARLHASVGSPEEAEKILERAIELSPRNAALFFDKGHLMFARGRNNEALEAFEQAILLGAKHSAALYKARVLIEMDRLQDAREALNPVLSLGDRFPEIITCYALTLMDGDNPDEALKYFRKAIRLNENDGLAWANMGIVLCGSGDYPAALEALDRAEALDIEPKSLTHYRCVALLGTAQYEVAIATAAPEDLSHGIFHKLLDVLRSHPSRETLQQGLIALRDVHSSQVWQRAFIGGLTEFASLTKTFDSPELLESLQLWNLAIKELFADQKDFSILVKLFDVIARVKLLGDRKALLELPREQRLLLIGEKDEEEFLNRNED